MMTANDILFDQDFLTIYINPDQHRVKLKWKKFATSDQFREGLNVALEAVIEHNAKFWLANLKNMEAILPADEEWAANVWFPKIAVTGIQKMAIVTSLDYFNNTSVKKIISTAQPVISFETKYFVDVKDAKAWLEL
ncbi:MAG: STAS/SEC14 domain-containing protein [Bacteroidetes bacterium]|nr:STAS/SEC14 domain-containing protein [Bacteroidota bacterium]